MEMNKHTSGIETENTINKGLIKENLFDYETNPLNVKYKKEHKFTEDFKRYLDKNNPSGTKIVDTLTGEVYITK